MRRFLIWSSRLLMVLFGLALLGAAYESVSEAADARAYPAPGAWSTSAATGCTSTVLVPAVRPWSSTLGWATGRPPGPMPYSRKQPRPRECARPVASHPGSQSNAPANRQTRVGRRIRRISVDARPTIAMPWVWALNMSEPRIKPSNAWDCSLLQQKPGLPPQQTWPTRKKTSPERAAGVPETRHSRLAGAHPGESELRLHHALRPGLSGL